MRKLWVRGVVLGAVVSVLALVGSLQCSAPGVLAGAEEELPGYTDTPYLPDGKWRVHDSGRPYPAVVTPGTFSTQEAPGRPPSDAVVLFDGRDLSQWQTQGQDGTLSPAKWKVENGYLEVAPKTGGLVTKEKFGDCQIHIEWASPTKIEGKGQGRGNSGVLVMGKYEIQVLDSYQNPTYSDGHASAMYGQYPPLVNALRKTGEWQVYDIVFEAPRFEGDKLLKPAYVTVFVNGVVVHNRQASLGPVRWRDLAQYEPHEAEGPILLQDHGNPVRFRNIWVRRLSNYPGE